MKHLLAFLMLTFIISSCKKGSEAINSNTSSALAVTPPPTATFKITNSNEHGVLEANILDFENTSKNGDSYTWDFGDGTSSSDKIPANFFYGTCGATHTITLTVKNKAGKTATFSEFYHVVCTRGGAPHDSITTITHK